jgi:hypothetical protein
LRDEIAARLTRQGARLHEYLEPAALRRFVSEIPSMEWPEPVWALYALELWLETCCSESAGE